MLMPNEMENFHIFLSIAALEKQGDLHNVVY